MKNLYKPDIYLVLLHYPVVNKKGNIIASAVTNLDLHDIARASKTYGVKIFYVVTPLIDQKELVKQITDHWTVGAGGKLNPKRKEALNLIKIKDSFEDVKKEISNYGKGNPVVVVTSAQEKSNSMDFVNFKKKLNNDKSFLLTFGTAWGLSDDIIHQADYILEPIKGISDYNHLSVRSAVSIVLDRLVGN